MSKKLNTDQIINELEGSAFFPKKAPQKVSLPPQVTLEPQKIKKQIAIGKRYVAETYPTISKGTGKQKEGDIKKTSNNASMLASYQESLIETVRKAVKVVGKEVIFVRLTQEEKNQLGDIVYTYKRQGVKTSENAVSRIAISHLLEDYRLNGKESILARVIAALLA